MQVEETDDEVHIAAYIAGLYSGQFWFNLTKEPPQNMAQLMLRAQKHMNAEEAPNVKHSRDENFDPQRIRLAAEPKYNHKRDQLWPSRDSKNMKFDQKNSSKRGGPPKV